MPLTRTYVLRGGVPGRHRPLYVRARRVPGACGARTAPDGGDGSGHADRPARLLASDLVFKDACALSSSPSSPGPNSVAVVSRSSVMRLLAASTCPSMQWA